MNKQLSIFSYQEHTVRIEMKDGEPWFCLADAAAILDIRNASPSRFNFNERGVHKMYTPTNSGGQSLTFVNESNLYRLIARSNKPEALAFQDWIFEEVLPAIRKTGSYSAQPQPALPATYLEALRELVKSEEEKQRIAHERDEALRTKAWISSSREASTLAKYGQAKRKIERLEDRLGKSRNWRQVKAIRWLGHYFDLRLPGAYSQIGRALADISAELDLPPRKVPHGEFNEVNAYHRGAIEAFRQRLDEGEKILAKYRRHEADFWA